MQIGDVVFLKGISNKGKQKVKEFGVNWQIHLVLDKVAFSGIVGGWIFVSPEGFGLGHKQARWVNEIQDKDFIVIPVK